MTDSDDDPGSWWQRISQSEVTSVAVALVSGLAVTLAAWGFSARSKTGPDQGVTRTEYIVPWQSIAAFAIAVGLMVGYGIYRSMATARRALDAQERADRALKDVSDPGDLLGFVRANSSQMHAYDLLARRQAAQSHRASIVSMFIGLALLAVGVAVAVLAPDPVAKVAGAGVTAVGAAVGGYIAQTFLTNSRSAAQTAAFYFRQPLVTSYLLTAERLASALPEAEQPLARIKVLEAAIAASIAAQSAALNEPGQKNTSAAATTPTE